MYKQKRWVLLEHKDSPDDPSGVHFDLLLEDKNVCRSWRLGKKLVVDGSCQEAVPMPAHRLKWLSVSSAEVSGGRGFAKRVMGGVFYGDLPMNEKDSICIELRANQFLANLEIKNSMCRLSSVKS